MRAKEKINIARFDFILYQMDKVSTSSGSGSRIFLFGLERLLLVNHLFSSRFIVS